MKKIKNVILLSAQFWAVVAWFLGGLILGNGNNHTLGVVLMVSAALYTAAFMAANWEAAK